VTYLSPRRFVHLGVNPRVGFVLPIRAKIETYLSGAVEDWYRFGAQNYVLWTNRGLVEIAQGLTSQPGLGDYYVFLTEFSAADSNGMMPKEFWDWLYKARPLY
jgi:hypothetical protein